MAPGSMAQLQFMSTTTASCASGYHAASEVKPPIPPPCPMMWDPRMSFQLAIPMAYRSAVPSFSFDGAIISAYDLGDNTLPPCSALSQVTRSPAVEQSDPAEKGQVWTLVGARRITPFWTWYPWARRSTFSALLQYIDRFMPSGANSFFST